MRVYERYFAEQRKQAELRKQEVMKKLLVNQIPQVVILK